MAKTSVQCPSSVLIPKKLSIISYLGLREVEQNLMMTEACGATNCTMMEVGEAIEGVWSY